ncbi:hypothetical protein [Fuerstiella marisgermanici]|uniref:Uncharacterized protein n=1 Tax=Fuerstiella marisgermanici TaxID=1891926 RepID=A0A1P8WDA4_9PLAN|nr:hypothetical protein [Fuerstiella marisgermanici]APZ92032.1 hypothetical protein Fuma_01636 [Fuerstiella marisgermanici]
MNGYKVAGAILLHLAPLGFLFGMGAAFDRTSFFTDKVELVWMFSFAMLVAGVGLLLVKTDDL